MTTLRKVFLLLSAHLSFQDNARAVTVGEEVCITGYIMDNFCIDWQGGRLLDNSNVWTLQNPELHSFHCLLDVDWCYESGYQVLGPKNPETDRHCLGFRIEETNAVLAAGRALGKKNDRRRRDLCSTCESEADSAPEFGYRATVKGVVSDLGDGSEGVAGTPVISNVQLLDESVGCDGSPTIPPMCRSGIVEEPDEIIDTPVPTKKPTEKPTPNLENEVAPGTEQSCPDTLDQSHEIDSSATLHYAVVPSNPTGSGNGLLCARLEAKNDDGWIGFAISEDGRMIGSDAIIGIPGDDTVLKYNLSQYSLNGVTSMSEDRQTLRDTSIEEGENGITVMEFTKLLVEEGEIAILEDGVNTFLHARGGESLGYHSQGRSDFEVTFSSSSKQSCPDTLDQSHEIDSSATLHYAVVPSNPTGSGNGLLCARLEAENDDGWIGFAISEDGFMTGSDAIIGIPGDDTVLKYDLNQYSLNGATSMSEDRQTLRDTSIEEGENGTTVMEFTKLLVEEGEIAILEDGVNIFLHARGGEFLGYHSQGRSMFEVTFSSSSATAATKSPSFFPTINPSKSPIASPTESPSEKPTPAPSTAPITVDPTAKPSRNPTENPSSTAPITASPFTKSPSNNPIATPTQAPFLAPTTPAPSVENVVTANPSVSPVRAPSTLATSKNDATPEPSLSSVVDLITTTPSTSPNSVATDAPSSAPVLVSTAPSSTGKQTEVPTITATTSVPSKTSSATISPSIIINGFPTTSPVAAAGAALTLAPVPAPVADASAPDDDVSWANTKSSAVGVTVISVVAVIVLLI